MRRTSTRREAPTKTTPKSVTMRPTVPSTTFKAPPTTFLPTAWAALVSLSLNVGRPVRSRTAGGPCPARCPVRPSGSVWRCSQWGGRNRDEGPDLAPRKRDEVEHGQHEDARHDQER